MKKKSNLLYVQPCGARSKRKGGAPCLQPAMENGRCRFHGGKTPKGIDSPHYKHGYYTKEAVSRRKQMRDILRTMRHSLSVKVKI